MNRLYVGLAFLLAMPAASLAADAPESSVRSSLMKYWDDLDVNTSLRGSYWSSDRRLTDRDHIGAATLWLKAQPRWSDAVVTKFEGWLTAERLFDGVRTQAELREAYVAYLGEQFEFRLGRQLVVWGRADRINPTDNISSRDYQLLFPEDDDQRRGNLMARARYAVNDSTTVSALWLPEFRPNLLPIPSNTAVGRIPDRERFDLGQFGVKIDHSGEVWDWSMSYFQGIDRNTDLGLNVLGPNQAEAEWRFRRIRAVGADLATNIGRYGVRAEAAYVMTQDDRGDNPQIKNPFLFAVIGADRTFLEYLNVNLQYLFRYTENFQDPDDIAHPGLHQVRIVNAILSGQIHRYQHGATLRVNHRWLNETLETEFAAVGFFNDGDFLLRPKIIYKVTDALRVTLGADYYSGPPENTVFGRLKDNSSAYFELRYGF